MKRLWVWLSLVVLFLGFYAFFMAFPGLRPKFTLVPVLVVWLAISIPMVAVILVRGYRHARTVNEGVALVHQGRVADALVKFQQVHDRSKLAVASYNVAYAQLTLWRIPEALAALDAYDKRARGLGQGSLDPLAVALRAAAHAMAGQEAQARAALDKVGMASSMSALAEVVLAARAQQWPAVKERMIERALELDQLAGGPRALLDTLTAWTASHLGGAGAEVSAVRLFRETSPDALRAAWPEVVAFVERVEAGPRAPA